MSLFARAHSTVSLTLRRNLGLSAVVANKAVDPIQKLFIQAIKEYDQKAKAAGGKLVDPSPETEKELKSELDRVTKIYGGGKGEDMTKFPSFNFPEPTFDPIDQQAAK